MRKGKSLKRDLNYACSSVRIREKPVSKLVMGNSFNPSALAIDVVVGLGADVL
jgi:hypothetical protein